MSIVFSEKTRRPRLALRWPFSRQITLSAGTLLVLLAVWWAVAAQQWVSPLFLPPPGQVLAKLITIAGPQGFMDATLWQHLGPTAGLSAADGDLVWHRGNLENLADLSGDFCPGCYVGTGWGEECTAGAYPRGAVAWCQPSSGAAVCDFTGRAAGDFNRVAHWPRGGLVNAGGG